jgi:hypothetical protein
VAEANGTLYVSSKGDSRAAQNLAEIARQEGYTYIPSGTDHAEVALYRSLSESLDFKGIGVSHKRGPCDACQGFFYEHDFVDVFWTGKWTR